MIRRLLIANRGEIALRVVHACRELGIETVAVFSAADRDALHVRAADAALPVGPAPAVESYLAIPRVIEAARTAGADAIHPGYGFLSENAAFARACAQAGITFVGPPADVIERLGSKIEARRIAAGAGVPIVPGETPADQSDAGVSTAIAHLGLPVLVKASAGGGGKGMRRVQSGDDVTAAIQAARREATAAFGDGTLYVERLITSPHHVEVQVFCDDRGGAVHLFERECSVQRRHQKVLEESPSPLLTDDLRRRMTAAALAVAKAAGYRNAGTVEFLVDAADGDAARFYFLEVNTRLQVEHPVTEQVVGVDLVRAQLLVASGLPLPWTPDRLSQRGHSIEARIYAEDPSQGFMPQAGRLTEYREPRLPGVRIDSGVECGSDIPVYYDPMIAKVIATAETRDLAIARLSAALKAFAIQGVRTNLSFLIQVLGLDAFRSGGIDTAFLDREGPRLVEQLRHESSLRPPLQVRKSRTASPESRMRYDPWDGVAVAAASRSAEPLRRRRSSGGGHQSLAAPMPASVIKVHVREGDTVHKGDPVVLLEAMKMELPLRAPADATVTAVRCREGDLVEADAILVELS